MSQNNQQLASTIQNFDIANLITMKMISSGGNESIFNVIKAMILAKLVNIIEKKYPDIWKYVKKIILAKINNHLPTFLKHENNTSILTIKSSESKYYHPLLKYFKKHAQCEEKFYTPSRGLRPKENAFHKINYKDFEVKNYEGDNGYYHFQIRSEMFSIEEIENFIQELYDEEIKRENEERKKENELRKNRICNPNIDYFYEVSPGKFKVNKFNSDKTFDNIYGEEIEKIKTHIDHFVNKKEWYKKKGIPHNLGLLLYGAPGCGKTSTIKAIANYTRRHVISIRLTKDTKQSFINKLFFTTQIESSNGDYWNISQENRIYLFEDIDCLTDVVLSREYKKEEKEEEEEEDDDPYAFYRQRASYLRAIKLAKKENDEENNKKKEEVEDDKKINLSFLLNVLDGVIERKDNIVIMTSNHPEKLDSALVRAGRIDQKVELKYCSNRTLKQMFNNFYEIEEGKYIFPECMSRKISPAEMNVILTSNTFDPLSAYNSIKEKCDDFELDSDEEINKDTGIEFQKPSTVKVKGYITPKQLQKTLAKMAIEKTTKN